MMQRMMENHGDGYVYMMERLNNYIERILAAKKESLQKIEVKGNYIEPAGLEQLPVELQDLLGGRAAEQSRLAGVRTGQLHLALVQSKGLKDFIPENFSLHYQRSLFSSMLALVRETFQTMQRNKTMMFENEKSAINELLGRKAEILAILKKIYSKKLDVVKIPYMVT